MNQDRLSEQEKEGEIVFSGREDLLASALEKREHPGRVRGVSQNITITDYFGHISRGKAFGGSGVREEDVGIVAQEMKEKMEEKLLQLQEHHTQSQAKSEAQIQEMQEFIVELLDKMKKDNPDLPSPRFTLQMRDVPEAHNVAEAPASCSITEPSPMLSPVPSTSNDVFDEV